MPRLNQAKSGDGQSAQVGGLCQDGLVPAAEKLARRRGSDGDYGGASEQSVERLFAEQALQLDDRGRACEGHRADAAAIDPGMAGSYIERSSVRAVGFYLDDACAELS